MAVERELDKTETNLGNIIFDESGYIILYPTMLGIKMVNLYTNRCIKIMGKPENIRPMQLALFQVCAPRLLQYREKSNRYTMIAFLNTVTVREKRGKRQLP